MWVRAQNVSLAETGGIYNGTADIVLGYRYSNEFYDGLIDEVIVFDRALSAAEVLEIYTYGMDGTRGGQD
jgi:hypothetical protein